MKLKDAIKAAEKIQPKKQLAKTATDWRLRQFRQFALIDNTLPAGLRATIDAVNAMEAQNSIISPSVRAILKDIEVADRFLCDIKTNSCFLHDHRYSGLMGHEDHRFPSSNVAFPAIKSSYSDQFTLADEIRDIKSDVRDIRNRSARTESSDEQPTRPPSLPTEAQEKIHHYARLSASEWADLYNVDPEALRQRLNRWRSKNHTGFVEIINRRSNEPQFLYGSAVVQPIIYKMASGKTNV